MRYLALVAVLALATACGGGGSGPAGSNPPIGTDTGPVFIEYGREETGGGGPPIKYILVRDSDTGQEWEFWPDPPIESLEIRFLADLPMGTKYRVEPYDIDGGGWTTPQFWYTCFPDQDNIWSVW